MLLAAGNRVSATDAGHSTAARQINLSPLTASNYTVCYSAALGHANAAAAGSGPSTATKQITLVLPSRCRRRGYQALIFPKSIGEETF